MEPASYVKGALKSNDFKCNDSVDSERLGWVMKQIEQVVSQKAILKHQIGCKQKSVESKACFFFSLVFFSIDLCLNARLLTALRLEVERDTLEDATLSEVVSRLEEDCRLEELRAEEDGRR